MTCFYCSTQPIDPRFGYYCSKECALDAEADSDFCCRVINRMQDAPVLRQLARRCWPKEQCESQGAAEAQMRSLLRRGLEKNADTVHVYHCPHCRMWHVGHSSC